MATSTNFGWTEPDDTDLVKNGASAMRTLGNAIDSSLYNAVGKAAGKNAVINGGFDIWQRGTTYALTTSQVYGSADRWGAWQDSAANGVANQTTSVPTGFTYGLKLGRNNGATGTGSISIRQALESIDSVKYAGQTVTLSFYAKAGANYSAASSVFNSKIVTGTGSNQSMASMGSWTGYAETNGSHTLTTSYQRFTLTATLSASETQIGLWFYYTPTGTAGADDNIYITGVQLELGSSATPFSRAGGTIQGELAACQRYYQRITSEAAYGTIAQGKGYTTGICQQWIPLKVPMRTAPTSIDTSAASTFICNTGATDITSLTSIAINTNLTNSNWLGVDVSKTASFTVGAFYVLYANNSTTSYIGASAEL